MWNDDFARITSLEFYASFDFEIDEEVEGDFEIVSEAAAQAEDEMFDLANR